MAVVTPVDTPFKYHKYEGVRPPSKIKSAENVIESPEQIVVAVDCIVTDGIAAELTVITTELLLVTPQPKRSEVIDKEIWSLLLSSGLLVGSNT